MTAGADEARAAAARTWSAGDYPALAGRLAPAAASLCHQAGPGEGRRAVDVAAGTGSVAIGLAREGWRVDAVDVSPVLVAEGRRAAAEAGVEVAWHEGVLDRLPVPDAAADLVASSFGLIFATDPVVALRDSRRVLRDGGRLVLTAWTPTSYMARMTAVMAEHLPAGIPMHAPFRWGDLRTVSGWLAEAGLEVERSRRAAVPWTFPDAATSTDFLFEASPGHIAAAALAGDGTAAMRDAVEQHLRAEAGPDGSVDLAIEYLLVTARAV